MLDRRSLLLSGTTAALSWSAGGPALAQAPTARPKTTLTGGVSAADIGQLDPHKAVGTPDRVAVSWIFNGLVQFPPGTIDAANLQPDLAESWESNADKTVWTFRLRPGVQFHAGFGEMTADDVVFSLQKAGRAATSAFAGDYRAFKSVSALDPRTVRVELEHAIPSLLGTVANYSGGFIVSKKAYEQRGDGFTRAPIGTGPFAFDAIVPNQSLNLVAHEGYFRGAPKLKRVIYRFLNANASRDLAYQSGELDITQGVQDQRWVTRFKGMPNTELDIFEPAELSQLSLNVESPLLSDVRVRRAIAHAINRDELIRWRGQDIARPGLSCVPSGTLGYTKDNGLPGFDLDRAKALLREAGHPNGLTIPIVQTQYPDMLNLMQVVQAQLARAGIKLEFQLVEHSSFHQMIRQDRSPIVMYAAARFPVADVYLTQFFTSRSIVGTPTAVTNFSHFKAADREIDAARTEPDAAKQLALWAEAQRKIIQDVAAIPLLETLVCWAHRTGFDYGFKMDGAMAGGGLLTEKAGFA
jgi:peptide/nickel transport system substrate-binding protein